MCKMLGIVIGRWCVLCLAFHIITPHTQSNAQHRRMFKKKKSLNPCALTPLAPKLAAATQDLLPL